jgi:hypothetical protein
VVLPEANHQQNSKQQYMKMIDYNTTEGGETKLKTSEGSKGLTATNGKRIYQYLQKTGLVLAAISSTVLALPFGLHNIVITVATVLGSVGSLAVAIGRILSNDHPSPAGDKPGTATPGIWHKSNVDKKAVA